MVCKDLENLRVKKQMVPQYIRTGIKSLEEQKGIVICPADKGGGLVILPGGIPERDSGWIFHARIGNPESRSG